MAHDDPISRFRERYGLDPLDDEDEEDDHAPSGRLGLGLGSTPSANRPSKSLSELTSGFRRKLAEFFSSGVGQSAPPGRGSAAQGASEFAPSMPEDFTASERAVSRGPGPSGASITGEAAGAAVSGLPATIEDLMQAGGGLARAAEAQLLKPSAPEEAPAPITGPLSAAARQLLKPSDPESVDLGNLDIPGSEAGKAFPLTRGMSRLSSEMGLMLGGGSLVGKGLGRLGASERTAQGGNLLGDVARFGPFDALMAQDPETSATSALAEMGGLDQQQGLLGDVARAATEGRLGRTAGELALGAIPAAAIDAIRYSSDALPGLSGRSFDLDLGPRAPETAGRALTGRETSFRVVRAHNPARRLEDVVSDAAPHNAIFAAEEGRLAHIFLQDEQRVPLEIEVDAKNPFVYDESTADDLADMVRNASDETLERVRKKVTEDNDYVHHLLGSPKHIRQQLIDEALEVGVSGKPVESNALIELVRREGHDVFVNRIGDLYLNNARAYGPEVAILDPSAVGNARLMEEPIGRGFLGQKELEVPSFSTRMEAERLRRERASVSAEGPRQAVPEAGSLGASQSDMEIQQALDEGLLRLADDGVPQLTEKAQRQGITDQLEAIRVANDTDPVRVPDEQFVEDLTPEIMARMDERHMVDRGLARVTDEGGFELTDDGVRAMTGADLGKTAGRESELGAAGREVVSAIGRAAVGSVLGTAFGGAVGGTEGAVIGGVAGIGGGAALPSLLRAGAKSPEVAGLIGRGAAGGAFGAGMGAVAGDEKAALAGAAIGATGGAAGPKLVSLGAEALDRVTGFHRAADDAEEVAARSISPAMEELAEREAEVIERLLEDPDLGKIALREDDATAEADRPCVAKTHNVHEGRHRITRQIAEQG